MRVFAQRDAGDKCIPVLSAFAEQFKVPAFKIVFLCMIPLEPGWMPDFFQVVKRKTP